MQINNNTVFFKRKLRVSPSGFPTEYLSNDIDASKECDAMTKKHGTVTRLCMPIAANAVKIPFTPAYVYSIYTDDINENPR